MLWGPRLVSESRKASWGESRLKNKFILMIIIMILMILIENIEMYWNHNCCMFCCILCCLWLCHVVITLAANASSADSWQRQAPCQHKESCAEMTMTALGNIKPMHSLISRFASRFASLIQMKFRRNLSSLRWEPVPKPVPTRFHRHRTWRISTCSTNKEYENNFSGRMNQGRIQEDQKKP